MMADLFEAAQLFEASVKLQTVSSWLQQLAMNAQPNGRNLDSLDWSAEFLERLGSYGAGQAPSTSSNHLAVQATTARPTYYASLFKIRHRLAAAGLKTTDEVASFVKSIHKLLRSRGQTKQELPQNQIELACELIHELSQGLLAQLDHNGL